MFSKFSGIISLTGNSISKASFISDTNVTISNESNIPSVINSFSLLKSIPGFTSYKILNNSFIPLYLLKYLFLSSFLSILPFALYGILSNLI